MKHGGSGQLSKKNEKRAADGERRPIRERELNMKRSKRVEALDRRKVNLDGFIDEWPEKGFIAMDSPYDPEPSVRVENGVITELDGKKRAEFDFIDQFIADYAIRVDRAEESMAVSSLEIARRIVDIHVSRDEILKLVSGITPAKMKDVINHLNVVELMMGMQKMRARRVPGNQAHITNLKDDPVQIAADAAEGALRGFSEEETTMGIARYAPFSAIALLIGSQVGRRGVLTQCSAEEATELELGIRGFTTYAETLSVYGTEKVFIDGDDTPYSKAFLNAAYASRGLKVRFTSGSGSEVLMGSTEKKSMLYLECRCLYMTKGAGSQGIQNGSVSCIGITASVPAGIREVIGENLVAALLGLECASSNDQSFSNSDMRRTARTMLQFMPGTDFIFSGYAAEPNYDNMFAGSNFDAEDFDDYNVIQRDMQVDGGLKPVTEEDVIRVRRKAGQAVQAVFRYLNLAEVTDEQVEAVTYAHGSKDTLNRDVVADLMGIEEMMKKGVTGIDVVKALAETGFDDVADSILNMLKQRVIGDYMHTAAILDEHFHVMSGVNTPNNYMGPGTGYRVDGKRWEEIKQIPHRIDRHKF
jgi:propanediol dehydratase large subunit